MAAGIEYKLEIMGVVGGSLALDSLLYFSKQQCTLGTQSEAEGKYMI